MDNNPKNDQLLYSASYREIFFKNFLVGFARGLGGIVVQILFLVILFQLYQQVLQPQLGPLLDTLMNSIQRLENLQQSPQSFRFELPSGEEVTTTTTTR